MWRGRVWPHRAVDEPLLFTGGGRGVPIPCRLRGALGTGQGRVGADRITLDPRVLGRPYWIVVSSRFADHQGSTRKRPSTSRLHGSIGDQLGLSSYLVSEGLVRRVVPHRRAERQRAAHRGTRLHERRRSSTLAFQRLSGRRDGPACAPARLGGWPSQNSLFGYVFLYDTWPGASKRDPPWRRERWCCATPSATRPTPCRRPRAAATDTSLTHDGASRLYGYDAGHVSRRTAPRCPRVAAEAPPTGWPRRGLRAGALRAHPGADHAVLGHVGIHRRGGTRSHPAPAGNRFSFVLSAHVWG